MKSIVFEGEKKLKILEKKIPDISDLEVLIKVTHVGLCGTDIAIWKGDFPVNTPLILGHEIAGEVARVGSSVKNIKKKQRCTVEINTDTCIEKNLKEKCFFCKKKIYSQCSKRKALGIHKDGGMCSYIAINYMYVHVVNENVSLIETTFVEPLAAAFQVFEMMPRNEEMDKSVCVFGAGKLGILVIQVCQLVGFEKIFVVDGSDKKLSLVEKLVKNFIGINRHEVKDIPLKIKEMNGGIGVDVVIDTSGSPKALKNVINSCRVRGKIHLKSTHGITTGMNISKIVRDEISIFSSRCGPYKKAIEALESGKVRVKDMVSKVYEMKDFEKAFSSKEKDHIKSVIKID